MNILNIEYGNNFSLEGMVQYLTDIKGHQNMHTADPIAFYTGFGVDPFNAARDMMALKQYYGRTLHRQYWHFEVSLENQNYNQTSHRIFYDIGEKVYNWSNCQLVMAIHLNTTHRTGCIHCHYLLNSVSKNGSMFTLNKYSYKISLDNIVNKVLAEYGLTPVNIPRNHNLKPVRFINTPINKATDTSA